MSRFIPTRQQNPCFCGDTSGKCRDAGELRLCMEYTDSHQSVPGLRFIGHTKDGLWGKWLPVSEHHQSEEARKRWQQEQALKRQLRVQAEARQRAASLSAPQRDRHYRHLLSQLTLHSVDKADLLRRGISEEEIQRWGVKSVERWQKITEELPYTLPGVDLNGIRLNISQPGYLCPVFDVEGYIVGFQIRLRKRQGGRYLWLTSRTTKRPEGSQPHLPNGELPLAVHRPPHVTRQAIALVEGVGAKPFLTAHRREQITVGAAGGLFASSPQTLKTTLAHITAKTGSRLIEFAVDGGAISNEKVLRQYRATWRLVQSWGYEVAILWWGQVNKTDPDIDELEDLTCVEAITVEQFEAMAQGSDRIFNRLLQWINRSRHKQPTSAARPTANPAAPTLVEYDLGDRLKTWQMALQQGKKIILDLSNTGGGKSYSAGQLVPDLLEVRQLIYISEQHRNPTVDTLSLENGWVDLEARHGGLVREKTANGSTRLKRAKPGESYAVPPNCNRIHILTVLRDKNIAGADTASRICGTCPIKGACQHQQGPGYGFLNQRRVALSSPKLRAHPHSLPDPTDYDLSSVALIWEEAACSFTTRRSIQVNKTDLQALINRLVFHPNLFQPVQPLLTQLLNLFDGTIKTGKFGLTHQELKALLPTAIDIDLPTIAHTFTADLTCLNTTAAYGVDLEDLPKTIQKQFLEKDVTLAEQADQQILKQWFVELLSILQGSLPGGSMYFHRHQLTLTLPGDRHRAIAQAAKGNIFLDATLTREDLALRLGCAPEEIFVCRQKQPCLNNLKLTQVTDMGGMGMHRGGNQQKRLAALIEHFRQVDPTLKVIDFKKFGQEGAHWRDSRGVNYFSQTMTLMIVGAPCPNLHDMLAQYATLIRQVVDQDDSGFQAWLHRQIEAEIQQEIGRLRATRRPTEQLHIVLVTDRPLSFPVETVNASDITPAAATKREQVILAARQAIEWLQFQGECVTQTAVAAATKRLGLNEGRGYSQQHISRHWQLLMLLIENLTSKTSNPGVASLVDEDVEKLQAVGQVLDAVATNPDPETVLEAIEQVFWDWLRPNEWLLVWQAVSANSQMVVLSALLGTLPVEKLCQLEVLIAN